ncbi:hypothetical protein [Paraburkholderia silvatlantica]|uniref:hypothetical protein n=1 Tax=Paraburkholderia silvatlantica TaxID=321895 RepID=UPI0011B4CD29|nr:hypothetical protein [Paraburkholderia silvatlantica]
MPHLLSARLLDVRHIPAFVRQRTKEREAGNANASPGPPLPRQRCGAIAASAAEFERLGTQPADLSGQCFVQQVHIESHLPIVQTIRHDRHHSCS